MKLETPAPIHAPAVFLSDVHLDHLVPDRIDRFERFLLSDLPEMGVRHLFLLGDIFNIWYVDQRLADLYGTRVLGILSRFVEGGGYLEFVVGNRDFSLWFDPSLHPPFPLHNKRILRQIGNLTFCLCHGDELATQDLGYRLLHGVIRQKLPMAAFHSLSSRRKEAIVRMLINLTHEVTRRKSLWRTQPYWPYVENLVDQGVDVCIHGHRHYRTYRILEGKNRMGRHFILPRWTGFASGLLYRPEEDRFFFFDR
jgi:UDP-2,3-diacylglucosamine pyrophosphatase LpxH